MRKGLDVAIPTLCLWVLSEPLQNGKMFHGRCRARRDPDHVFGNAAWFPGDGDSLVRIWKSVAALEEIVWYFRSLRNSTFKWFSGLPVGILVAGLRMRLFIGLLAITASTVWAGLEEKVFEKEITTAHKLSYLLDLPPGFEADGDKKWPLLVFLHGAGERGNDLNKVKAHGPPKLSGKMKELESFVIASPQCPADAWWNPDTLKPFVDDLIERYNVDRTRVYLTGLSMGGYGTWSLATRYSDTFAAVAPICGSGTPYLAARRMKDLPVWVFHGAKDPVVKLEESNLMVGAFKALKVDIKFTVYPEAGHDSWTKTYANPELYKWLLSHKRAEKK